ncbi:MAG: right-handed parallel beta-helix repeat-containing protein [Candidatus Bipolaricaulota bacterium]
MGTEWKRLAVCAAVLAVWMVGPSGLAEDQPECTITVQPDQSIQEIIDNARQGDVICLAEGTWEENIVIEKSLTLRGQGAEHSLVHARKEGPPVIEISSPEGTEDVQVVLEDLSVTGGNCEQGYGILVGDSVRATITSCTISGNKTGIYLWGSAEATIERNRIVDNRGYGVALYEQPCVDTDEVFIGRVAGYCNKIRRPGMPEGNEKGTVCPDDLEFLHTEEGGELVRRGLEVTSTAGGEVSEPGEGLFAYKHGTEVQLLAEAESSYRFVGWGGDIATIDNPKVADTAINVLADCSIVAEFAPLTYTITATSTEGGTIDPECEVNVEHGENQTFSLTPDRGWEIEDVLVDEESVGAVDEYTFEDVTEDHTIHAEFARIERELNVSSTVGGKVTDPEQGVHAYGHGTEVELRAEADHGYRFVGWTGDVDTIDDPKGADTAITMLDDYTIEAEFEQKVHKLFISSTQGGAVYEPWEGVFTYDHGTEVELRAEADCGYRFVEWTGDIDTIDDPKSADTAITMLGDYAIVAEFKPFTCTITATATEGGTIEPAGKIGVELRGDQMFTICPDGCYQIADVQVDGESVGAVEEYTFEDVRDDRTIHVEFEMGDVVQPGESIQQAIDQASAGDVICLAQGEWVENLRVDKSVTLRGRGAEQTLIRAEKEDMPVVRIGSRAGEDAPRVVLEELQVAGARGYEGYGIMVEGQAQATISRCEVSDNKTGIMLWLRPQATIEGTTVAENERHGIVVSFFAHATIEGNKILANGGYGVTLYTRPSYDVGVGFSGYVTGARNTIPGTDEPDGNELGAVPPCRLAFLMTEEGGELDRRQ